MTSIAAETNTATSVRKAERSDPHHWSVLDVVLYGLGIVGFLVAAYFLWPARWGGSTTLTIVNGHSMEPTLRTGDLLLARRQQHYKTGDIIVFSVDLPGAGGRRGFVVHRIKAFRPDGTIVTQGDNRATEDNFILRDDGVIGKVRGRLPRTGLVMRQLSNRFVMAGIAGLLVAAYFWPVKDEDDEDEDEDEDDNSEVGGAGEETPEMEDRPSEYAEDPVLQQSWQLRPVRPLG